MREFRIRLRDAAFDGLVDRALRERRSPAEQAAWLLERTILRSKGEAPEPVLGEPVRQEQGAA